MLLRQTILYLPAQLLGPLSQMVATVVWTHYLSPEAIGTYAIIWAIQELAGLVMLSWWSSYLLRYATAFGQPQDRNGLDAMEWAVQIGAAFWQAAFALAALMIVAGVEVDMHLAAAAIAFTVTRNAASHFSDRARARFEITAYSAIQILSGVGGFALALVTISQIAPTPEVLLWSYAAAQLLGLVAGVALMDIKFVKPKVGRHLLRFAWRYGAPLFVASVLVWVGSHAIRFIVQYEQGVAAVGYVTVGWWLGMRLTSFVSVLVISAAFPLAVETIRKVGPQQALPQFATNGALLLSVLVPSVAGVVILNEALSTLLVDPQFAATTIAILPMAVAAGAVRAFKNHGSDQTFLLFERTTLNVWSTIVEAVATVVLCWIGLRMGGLPGAVAGCLAAAIVGQVFSFVVANRLFGYYLRAGDLLRIGAATGAMAAVLILLPLAHTLVGLLAEVAAGVAVYALAIGILYPAAVREGWGKVKARLARG